MAKKKAKKTKGRPQAGRRRGRPSANSSSVATRSVDRKIQQQYYVTQSMVDSIEKLRARKEADVRKRLGHHVDLSTSQFVGSVLHDLVKKAEKAGAL